MRILVSGSEGILGLVLKKELRRRGHLVYGCDLMHSSDPQYFRADISERRQLSKVFDIVKPEVVYWLAAEFGRKNGEEFFEQLWKSNCIGVQNAIEECVKNNAHLVFASSSEAYGDTADMGILCEDTLKFNVPKFWNNYALSKYTNEKQIEIAIRTTTLRATVLRFFNAWGEGELYSPYRSVVCLFAYRLLKGLPITVYKNYHRAFMHVSDWVMPVANVAHLSRLLPNGMAINIAGEEYTSVEDMTNKILNVIGGSQSEITFLDKELANIQNKKADITLAKEFLDYAPTVTLDSGLPGYIAWLKKEYGI